MPHVPSSIENCLKRKLLLINLLVFIEILGQTRVKRKALF
ncbi:Uncharacterised protein [Vibrio cholerae]|nr:Uncharacterised protein [Vibrio cholerae]